MSLDTDFNQAPYYDDFDEGKNFHRVLFKPGVAVQARELTQLQTILQNQIERFGDSVLREGTIVRGCNFQEVDTMGYVKILDLQTNGQPVVMSAYNGAKAIGVTTGIEAVVQAVDTGLESQTPNLSTIFIKYLTSGSSEEKTFSTSENIEIRDINSNDLIATVTAAGSVEGSAAVGSSYGVRVGEGVIYQKGHFIRVDNHLTIVSKYNSAPDSVVVGFQTVESTVNSNNDTSLLDNSQGTNNENAPGADRLKLTATLVKRTLAEAEGDEEFFAIQEYDRGKVVRRNKSTQFEGILEVLRERTKDESGNYTVNDFSLRVGAHASNTDLVSLFVGAGKAYVEGRRVELLNSIDVDVEKSTDFETEEDYSLATNIGNYLLVDEYMGNFDTSTAAKIYFFSAAQNAATGGAVPSLSVGSAIGTAYARAVLLDEGTAGTAAAKYRMYVFDIQMESGQNWDNVSSVYYPGTTSTDDGVADLVDNNIRETGFKKSLFVVGNDALKSVPAPATALDFIYRTVDKALTISTSGVLEITLSSGSWPYGDGALNATQLKDIHVISEENQDSYVLGQPVDLSGASAVVSGPTLTISGLSIPTAAVDVIAHYNVKESSTLPANKDLKTVYVKVDAQVNAGHADGLYSLGLPDVYSIENVWAGSTYANTNTDVASSFTLRTGQQDTHYGLSAIRRSKNLTIDGTNDKWLIKAKVFQRDNSGSYGSGFFTVSSYPVNDVTPSATTIKTEEIPLYTQANGVTVNLRDVVDMRPQVANTINYEENEATAIANTDAAFVNPNTAIDFGSSDLFLAAPNELLESDYEYYLARRDIVMIGENGNFIVKQGDPAVIPTPPSEPGTGMVLATLSVPPFPSLPKREADTQDRSEYGITISRRENKRYTMRDIGGIETRVKNLEYYTSLNALEVAAKDLVITDATGTDRFKNGIFVDNFADLTIANVKDASFSASVDPSAQELAPRFKAFPMDLTVDASNSSGVSIYSDAATLENQGEVSFINQPYATKDRSCTTDFYSFNGSIQISPTYDSGYDTTFAPSVDIGVDLTDAFSDFVDELSEFVPLSRTSRETIRSGTSRRRVTTTVSTTTQLAATDSNSTTERVGDFITDIAMSPFMRAKPIRIVATGLRPNTRHYFFFDGTDVNAHVAPAQLDATNTVEGVARNGLAGANVTSDSNGTVVAIFYIPAETFFVGDRELVIADTSTFASVADTSSVSRVVYHAFNFSVEKTSLTNTTRIPEFDEVVTDVSTNVTIRRRRDDGDAAGRTSDPIAQTFQIKGGMTNDEVVLMTSLDIFFKSKSATKGVTVYIRETENGFPAGPILPFGTKHLRSSEVNDSDSNSGNQIATRVTFDAPVVLNAGVEYCFVVMPDSNDPDYRIWVAETGQTDVASGLAITQDSHDGTLFTSTNNRAWTPYQNENIKFEIYKGQYNDAGSLALTNKNSEFFTVDTIAGNFSVGERVGVNRANTGETIAVTTSSKTITGTGLDIFQAGDYFAYYANTTTLEILQVDTPVSNTEITVKTFPPVANASADFFKTIVGDIAYFDRNTPGVLHLENSSAADGTYSYTDYASANTTANNYFAAGETIFGENSQATANVASVDDLKVSYIQPNIYRTDTAQTNAKLSADILTNEVGTNYASPAVKMAFNNNAHLIQEKTVIESKSNELPGGDSFRLKVDLENTVNSTIRDSSPLIDFGISNATVYAYQINNEVTSGSFAETNAEGDGPATSKYISRTVELADNFDSDDMKVYLTGYRPAGTDIEVYVRFQNVFDTRETDNVEWTRMDLKPESDTRSSASNLDDFKEFVYEVPELPAASFTSGGGASLNTNNNDVLRYHAPDGTIFDRYRTFTVKIVLLSTGYHRVPRVADVRAIALT